MHTRTLYFCLLFITFCTYLSAQNHIWKRTNPGGGGAFSTIEAGPSAPNGAMQIVAGSDLSGAYYSWDGGQSWEVYGSARGLTATHISAIGFHPTDSDIFFLGADGGIFKSNSGGGFFYPVLTSGYVTDIEVSAVNPQIVFAAVQSEYNIADAQVYVSTDGGNSFIRRSTNLPNQLHLLEIVAHPSDINILYALAGEGRFSSSEARAYRSLDRGETWEQLTPSNEAVMHIATDPFNSNVLYLTTMLDITDNGVCIEGNKGFFYKSTDNGLNWSGGFLANYTGIILPDFENVNTIRLIDPRCPYSWLDDSGTWTSTDGGMNWNRTGNPNTWRTGFQTIDAPHWSYVTSYNGLSKTIGSSKADPTAFFWTNVQWAFGSFDGGTNFQHLHTKNVSGNTWQSTGCDNVVMYDIAAKEIDPNEIYLGFADIGLWRSMDGGESWEASNPLDYTGDWQGFGGNCRSILPDPSVTGKVWVSMQGNPDERSYLLRSMHSGQVDTWEQVGIEIPTNTTRLLGLSIRMDTDPTNRTLFVTANGDVYRSVNDGENWSRVLSNGGLYFTTVDNFNGQIVYAGGSSGLYRSTNGGSSWTRIVSMPTISAFKSTDPLDEQYLGISSIVPHPIKSGSVYYSLYGGNSSAGGIYLKDGLNNSPNLLYANPYLRAVAVSKDRQNNLYGASSYAYYRGFYHPDSKGILFSDNGGANWLEVNEGMAWSVANCLEITRGSDPRIFAGSPGTGFQYAPLGGTATLSIEDFIPFTAQKINQEIILNWQSIQPTWQNLTLQRANADHIFTDVVSFTSPNIPTQYIDIFAKEDIHFYRLKIKNTQEQWIYSDVLEVHLANRPTVFTLSPNPCKDRLEIATSITNSAVRVVIYNVKGQLMHEQNNSVFPLQLTIKNWSAGMYWVSLLEGEKIIERFKLLKLDK